MGVWVRKRRWVTALKLEHGLVATPATPVEDLAAAALKAQGMVSIVLEIHCSLLRHAISHARKVLPSATLNKLRGLNAAFSQVRHAPLVSYNDLLDTLALQLSGDH